MPKKRPNSAEFFREMYAPALQLIEERRIRTRADKLREQNRIYQIRYRAKTQPKLSPEAYSQVRRAAMKKAIANMGPIRRSIAMRAAAKTRLANWGREARKRMAEIGGRNIAKVNNALTPEQRRDKSAAAGWKRWGIGEAWPFPRPHLSRAEKKRLALRQCLCPWARRPPVV